MWFGPPRHVYVCVCVRAFVRSFVRACMCVFAIISMSLLVAFGISLTRPRGSGERERGTDKRTQKERKTQKNTRHLHEPTSVQTERRTLRDGKQVMTEGFFRVDRHCVWVWVWGVRVCAGALMLFVCLRACVRLNDGKGELQRGNRWERIAASGMGAVRVCGVVMGGLGVCVCGG